MHTLDEIKKQEAKKVILYKECAEKISFSLVDRAITAQGGFVFCTSGCLIDTEIEQDFKKLRKIGSDTFIKELYDRFEACLRYLNEKLKYKGWIVDSNYVFDFPARKLVLVQYLPDYECYLIHFRVVPLE